MKPAAKTTTKTGRISSIQYATDCQEMPQPQEGGIGAGASLSSDPEGRFKTPKSEKKIAAMDEGSGAAQYRRSK
jgi:hypothetical protein